MNWPRSSFKPSPFPRPVGLDDSATGGSRRPLLRRVAGEVATRLGMPLAEIIQRTDAKRYHGPAASLEQTPYTLATEAAAAIVLDDLITSGQTMKLSLEAPSRTGPRMGLCLFRELKPCPSRNSPSWTFPARPWTASFSCWSACNRLPRFETACIEKLQLTAEQANVAIEHAKKAILDAAEIDRDKARGEAVFRFNDLYERSLHMQDVKSALAAQKELNRLLALHATESAARGTGNRPEAPSSPVD